MKITQKMIKINPILTKVIIPRAPYDGPFRP